MIGQLLLNRYELLAKIGDGGMALVYRAKDTLLNRLVAVKVLRDQFASDEEFIERFRREAQAAASLSHPNVVNIYDVGHDHGIHFIVMEYVPGRNLSEVIRTEQPLEEDFMVDVAVQMGRALSHAHQRNIVHRDIKPHNILITDEGRVKVTDFGIARAMSAANLTQTGMVIGSVHYFSPEQAKGATVKHTSDLYSFGVVLYEMITGRVPFRGDTPIAVALKHIQEDPIEPKKLRPDIHPQLNELVLRLLAKEPEQRLQDAYQVVKTLRGLQDGRDQLTWHTGRGRQVEKTQIMPVFDEVKDEGVDDVPKKTKNRKRKKSGRGLSGIILILFFLVAAGWAVQRMLPAFLFPEEVTVPNIIGLERDQAEAILRERGLRLGVDVEVFDNEIPENHVISQDPSPNRRVRENRTVFVRLSKGAEYVSMPDVVGQSLREARLNLTQAGFTLGEEIPSFSAELPLNAVIEQQPAAGERVQKGIAVDLVVNRGEQAQVLVRTPDLRGLELSQARERLTELDLELGNAWPEYSTEVRENRIIEQNPQPGTEVEPGWTVDVVYSQGLPRGATPETAEEEEEIQRWTEESPWQSVEVRINVPEGPPQEVVILVIDDFGAREVYRETRSGGASISRTVQGRGEGAKLQVYIGGRMFLDKLFREYQ